ncbi:vacuolar protein sorting/targeting protein PEP1 [Tulasnella sp. 332]|nr:vacuolar protein sorting/targeting protein PEP1 [Tulasnella sp. 332]
MASRYLHLFLWTLLLYALGVPAQNPVVKVTPFKNQAQRIFYFDDTSIVLIHDPVAMTLYRSDNEGKDWKEIEMLRGKTLGFVPHPHDNRYAFVLTKGKTHYRTTNRGETWQAFEMPLQPALVSSPLSFHADKDKYGHILYQGTKCEGWYGSCHDETYYTEDAFGDTPKLLLSQTSKCLFARNTKAMKEPSSNLILCVAFDVKTADGAHTLSSSRLFSSEDYFQEQKEIVSFGSAKIGRGVVAIGIVSKFMVAALQDMNSPSGEMMLYVSMNGQTWSKAKFPHASSSALHENAYTIVESTTHSLAVDVQLHSAASVGTLFVSNSNGTFFTQSLKDTNRNFMGYVDFEELVGVEGVGIANIISNAEEVETRLVPKKLHTLITYDDGRTWSPIKPPATDLDGKAFPCPEGPNSCSLHLYSVTSPHNFGRIFSSPAPGFVMGVGHVGDHLIRYEDCDTFLSTDAGLTWKMVHKNAHMYEFGDQGSVMVIVDDEEFTDRVRYSWDDGKTWEQLNLGVTLRAKALTTIPDSTSQKFLLMGTLNRASTTEEGKHAMVFLDFLPMNKRQCTENDFEKWYARTADGKECLMGHRQWYTRRKADADCYVGHKFQDPVEHEDNCPCSDEDYECDYNYVREGDKCVSVGPEPIPADVCPQNRKGTYLGSSGYRRIPGNTCIAPSSGAKDAKVEKDCSKAQPPEGKATHQTASFFKFPGQLQQYMYFRNSHTILVQVSGGQIWQSSNEGYTWSQIHPEDYFLAVYLNLYWDDRAYLITNTRKIYMTTDAGQQWNQLTAPTEPNPFGVSVLNYHPSQTDWLIWVGASGCAGNGGPNCQSEAYYSKDHGRHWYKFETYVRQCIWARDKDIKIDERQILCESYREKKGDQMKFNNANHLELISGRDFYNKKEKLFESVVGFARFSEYLLVAEIADDASALDLQVSLDGKTFSQGLFPPNMRLDNHAYTILESSTDSVFLHVTMSQVRGAEWGNVLKSNSNGTYYGLSLEHVNRNDRGYVDFEKVIGLDGIAVMNVVANVDEAAVTGKKKLQTRITHNDGGTWKPLTPPVQDSVGQPFECTGAQCALHIHGYTERFDARATYSSPSAVGLMMVVGNVGTELKPYTESDTFFSRDGGFTWEEVHKDAHLFEFGDSGSVLVMTNDEGPTDRILFSLDEGMNWREYVFASGGDQKIRVREIVTVPKDTSRKFILFGYPASSDSLVAIHIDLSNIANRQCTLDADNPNEDDFELWSPSQEREELCLFGRQTLYHRRRRDRNCYVGEQAKAADRIVKNCQCSASDFECEFNHVRNNAGECELVEGATPLPNDSTCPDGQDFWYERTAYRKIPYSSCEGGIRPDQGAVHICPGIKGHSALFWLFFLILPFAFAAFVGYKFWQKGGFSRGAIRLPEAGNRRPSSYEAGPLDTLASIPYFLIGVAGVAWSHVSDIRIPYLSDRLQTGYRNVPIDEDAQVLRFEDEE